MPWPDDYASALADQPPQTAQDRFNRVADAFSAGLKNVIETPGRAMKEGITTDQAVDWAAPMAMGMVGAPGAPAGAVGSGLTRALRTGDNAAIDAMRIAAREQAERGGSTVRVYDTQRQIDASRGLTEADQGAEKAKAGWQMARNSALDDFRAAIAGEREPPAVPREYEPDPFSPPSLNWPPGTDAYPPRGLTAKEQMRLSDSLANLGATFGSGANDVRGSAANVAIAAGSPQQGIRAYHGSPYDFDRFDLNKIGTGEGAQAYGHGLYFAEAEPVARQYRDNLSGGPVINGVDPLADWKWLNSTSKRLVSSSLEGAQKGLGLSGDDAVRAAMNMAKAPEGAGLHERQTFIDAQNAIGSLLGKGWGRNPGKMYEVNIGAKPEQFLDWDKPLSQQGEPARKALNEIWGLPSPESQTTMTGSDVYRTLASARGGERPMAGGQYTIPYTNEPRVTAEMREAGIPGIRYLDQGSRTNVNTNDLRGSISMFEGALRRHPGDEMLARQLSDAKAQLAAAERGATSNYVVFDPSIIDILRKYGLAGPTAGGASYAAGVQDRQ